MKPSYERLENDRREMASAYNQQGKENRELREQLKTLTSENERLKKLLEESAGGFLPYIVKLFEERDYLVERCTKLTTLCGKLFDALKLMLEHAEELRTVEETRLGEKRAKSNQCGYYEEIEQAKLALAEAEKVMGGEK